MISLHVKGRLLLDGVTMREVLCLKTYSSMALVFCKLSHPCDSFTCNVPFSNKVILTQAKESLLKRQSAVS